MMKIAKQQNNNLKVFKNVYITETPSKYYMRQSYEEVVDLIK